MAGLRNDIFEERRKELKPQFLFLLCVLTVCGADDGNCLKCEELNRLSSIECPIDLAECGDCISGFIPDKNDPRFCFQLKALTTIPMLIEEAEGQLIELPCEFNSKVECVWERNGQHVAIDDSHRYLFKNKEVNELVPAEDCSLIIENFSPIDVGQWQCRSRDTSSALTVKSALITLSLKAQNETQATDISGENAIRLYLDGESADGRAISIIKLKNGSALECRAEVAVDELRWEIDGQSIVSIFNARSVRIKSEDIERYFKGDDWPFAKVYCVAVFNGHKDINSFAFITNQNQITPKPRKKSEEGSDDGLSTAATTTIVVFVPCALLALVVMLLFFRR